MLVKVMGPHGLPRYCRCCDFCGERLSPKLRSHAKYCSVNCRTAAYRERKAAV